MCPWMTAERLERLSWQMQHSAGCQQLPRSLPLLGQLRAGNSSPPAPCLPLRSHGDLLQLHQQLLAVLRFHRLHFHRISSSYICHIASIPSHLLRLHLPHSFRACLSRSPRFQQLLPELFFPRPRRISNLLPELLLLRPRRISQTSRAGSGVCCIGILLLLALNAAQAQGRVLSSTEEQTGRRALKTLVPDQPLVLEYHGGKVLGAGAGINVYILWYGAFSWAEKSILTDFIKSIELSGGGRNPSVTSWWKLTAGYKEASGEAVPSAVKLAGQAANPSSLGKNLKQADLETLVQQALDSKKLPVDAHGLYFLLTAADIAVEDFCMNSCSSHAVLKGSSKLPFAWVGNSGSQCPGMCAWPFAAPAFPGAPAIAPAKSPNGDIGIDGMVINIASMLAGASTNPFGNAYYQGDTLAPLEAATACTGNFGANSFPGYPGDLLTDSKTGGNFNVYGLKRRRYLVPSLWNPASSACAISA